jgi:hypothetical protein
LEGNKVWHTTYQLLHENLYGVAKNGKLDGEECRVAENDFVESGNWEVDEEMIHGRTP